MNEQWAIGRFVGGRYEWLNDDGDFKPSLENAYRVDSHIDAVEDTVWSEQEFTLPLNVAQYIIGEGP